MSSVAFGVALREERVPFTENEPLARRVTFRCGGPARWYVSPRNPDELSHVLRAAAENGLGVRMLGRGACLLVRDEGVEDVVVRLAFASETGFRNGLVEVEAGTDLPRLVRRAAKEGRRGLEGLAGVPGSVGGAIIQNAGGRHGEIGARVAHVDVMGSSGERRRLSREEVGFRYRGTALENEIVLGCGLKLDPDDPAAVEARTREVMEGKKATQPLNRPSAGCVFKNPPGDHAGRLIEACGFKGASEGGAVVSPRHANFIVNEDGCRSVDVLRLIDRIQEGVLKETGKELELELTVW